MEYFRIGSDSRKVSRICMGGSSPKADLFTESAGVKAFEEALETAYSIGINFFDNAEAYGGGKSEEILGKVLAPKREKVFLSSKASGDHSSAKELRMACENSLRNLNTSYIDLYYLHYPNRSIPIGESISTLMELKEEGKIGAIGLSNFSLDQISRAAEYGKIDALQQCYSLLWRSYPEKYLFPYCRKHDIKIMAYGPLASGLLSGKYGSNAQFDVNDQRARQSIQDGLLLYLPEWWSKSIDVVDRLLKISHRYNATLAQMAIRWVLLQESISSVVIGANKSSQVVENTKSLELEIDPEDLAAMDNVSLGFTSTLPMLVNYYLKMRDTSNL